MSRTYAFIPARGSSQRVPRKNLQEVGTHSLLYRAIDAADDAGITNVVVSTDSDEIVEEARQWYCDMHGSPCVSVYPHARPQSPAELPYWLKDRPTGDTFDRSAAQLEWWIAHWMHRADPALADDDVVCVLQCTSPFTRPETIRECIRMVREEGCDSALTVTMDVKRAAFSGRVRALYDEQKQKDVGLRVVWDRPYNYRPRTQDVRPVPIETGGVYCFTAKHFRATSCRMGGREAVVPISWLEAWDVDDVQDLEVARILAPHVERLMACS